MKPTVANINRAAHFFYARRAPLALVGLTLIIATYLLGVPDNPPGFFVDESSIAYNAHTISRLGRDEHGTPWPLYFRAFGEYKSPLYIYLLAALYKVCGPSILAARLLSALLGIAAAAVLGLLALRLTRRRWIGIAVASSALLTPWLFEISRLVFEVALLPLALALFLLALHAAYAAERWSRADSVRIAATLALITYTYSGGRLLAPLLALGLAFFITRRRWRAIARTWFSYALTLLPLFVFSEHHPGALGSRFGHVSYITPQSTWPEIALRFTTNYLGNFSLWSWLIAGDPEPRHHVQTMGSLLAATVVIAAGGLILILLNDRYRRDPWWRFILYGLVISAVPSSLTIDHFHTLRLIALPVFLLVLGVPALAWSGEASAEVGHARRAALSVLLALTLLQGAIFQWQFQREAPRRWHNFDTFYPEVFAAAIAQPTRPIYLLDNHGAPGYVHAYWYATLQGLDTSQFVRLPKEARPPAGALVISSELPCTNCRIILERASFRAYITF